MRLTNRDEEGKGTTCFVTYCTDEMVVNIQQGSFRGMMFTVGRSVPKLLK